MLNDELEFQALFGDLASLKRARNVLTALQASLDDDIARLEKEVYPPALHYGISSVPDEILERIIVAAAEEKPFCRKENNRVWDLAMVSKRFCRVVNSSREAWANINLQDGYDTIQHKLAKAGGSKLAITLRLEENNSKLGCDPDALRLLDRQMHNCGYLHLCPSEKRRFDYTWDTVTFPSTTTLVLAASTTFHEQWTFPNLRTLYALEKIPPSHFCANLTYLELYAIRGIVEALQTARRLETLVLHGVPYPPDDHTFLMPRLASLTVRVEREKDIRGSCLDEVARFTRNFRAPALVVFHLHFNYDDLQKFLPDVGVQFFPTDIPMDHVQDVSFGLTGHWYDESYFDTARNDVEKFIPSFLSRFPSLEGFTLHATDFIKSLSSFEPILSLRRFHVYGIHDELAFLPQVINALKNSDAADIKLREVYLHARHNLKSLDDWRIRERRLYHEPHLETKLVLEHRIGKTVISVMETTDLRQGELEASKEDNW